MTNAIWLMLNRACACTCVCTCACVCLCVRACVCAHAHMCLRIPVCTHVCWFAHLCMCVCTHVCVVMVYVSISLGHGFPKYLVGRSPGLPGRVTRHNGHLVGSEGQRLPRVRRARPTLGPDQDRRGICSLRPSG